MKLVFEVYAASDPNGTPLGELTDATDKFVRVQYNGDGEGRFQLNRHSSQAAWFEPDAPPTYIKAYIDDLSGDPIFGFLPDNGGDTILAAEEEGAEEYTRSGLGGLSYLADAVLFHKNYTTNDAAIPKGDGLWHWANRPVGAILVRQLEEAKARGCFPFLTWDFSRTLDSASDAWTDSPAKYKLPIGMGLRDQVSKAQSVGIVVKMDPDLVLHAYDDHPGADVSGSVILQAAVNLRDAVERQVQASAAISRVLVQGETDAGKLKFRSVGDSAVLAAIGRRREGFVQYTATPTNSTLDRAGHKAIDATKSQYDGPTSVPVLIRAGEVPFTDYQPGDMVGIVLPGLAGAIRVAAIALVETETGEVDPVLDLGEETFDPFEVLADGVGPGGTGGVVGTPTPPPVQPFVPECAITDTFDRADGASGISDAGYVWSDFGSPAPAIVDGRLYLPAHYGNTSLPVVVPSPYRVLVEFELTGTNIELFTFELGNAGAIVGIFPSANEVEVTIGAAFGSVGASGPVAFTFAASSYTLRAEYTAANLKVRIWPSGDTEPGTWLIDFTDGTPPAYDGGQFGVNYQLTAAVDEVYIDNLDIDGVCGSPCEGTVVDNFNRADGAIGTATNGLVWEVGGGGPYVSISGNRMLVEPGDDPTSLDFGSLPLPTGVTFEFEPAGALGPNPAFVLDNADLYILPGSNELQLFYNSDYPGAVTIPFTFVGGTVYKFRLEVTHDTIRVKVWELADPEPSAWAISITDPVNSLLDHLTEFRVLPPGSGADFYLDNLTMFRNCTPPPEGQFVFDAEFIGDGVTTAFLTEFAYLGASLHPIVNGLDWSAQVTEVDPTTGDYTLAYPYPLGATVRPGYQAGP